MKHLVLISIAMLLLPAAGTRAQDKPARVYPMPLYEQCRAWSESAAADDELARNILRLKDTEQGRRIEAAAALARTCDKRTTEPLIRLLMDGDPAVRIAGVEALGRIGDPASIYDLSTLISDPDWQVRRALIKSLASFTDTTARNWVLNGIAHHNGATFKDVNEVIVRCIAILTLNELKNTAFSRKGIMFLEHFDKSESPEIRKVVEETMFALRQTHNGPPEIVGIIKTTTSPEIRCWMIDWTGRIGLERARDTLNEILAGEKNQSVRDAASRALKALDAAKKP